MHYQLTRCSWKLLVFLLRNMDIPGAALLVMMTSWSSFRPQNVVCSSGPFPKDVEIVQSTSHCFPYLVINIVLLILSIARPLPSWSLLMKMEWSNCGLRPAPAFIESYRSFKRLFQHDLIGFFISLSQLNFSGGIWIFHWCWFLLLCITFLSKFM